MTKIGSIRVNATHYTGIVVEEFDYHNASTPFWAVPAWEERGEIFPGLVGPFPTPEQAQIQAEEISEELGLVILPPILRDAADHDTSIPLREAETNRSLMALAIAMTKSVEYGSPILARCSDLDVKLETARTIADLLKIECVVVDYDQVATDRHLRTVIGDYNRHAAIVVLNAPGYRDQAIADLRDDMLSAHQYLILFSDGEAPAANSSWAIVD